MNLYDLSAQIDPDEMAQRDFKQRNIVLARKRLPKSIQCAFLAHMGSAVDLCVTGMGKFRMYTRTNGTWQQTPREEYDAWVKRVKQVKAGTQIELELEK